MAKRIRPQDHPLWESFTRWAGDNGVELDYEEDWRNWWDCFLAGATAFANGEG